MYVPEFCRESFLAHLPVIQAIIRGKAQGDEQRQNALCWAWLLWVQSYTGRNCDELAKQSAIIGVRRRFDQFGKAGCRSTDALDHLESAAADQLDIVATRGDDPPSIGFRIENMPQRLRVFALPLSKGANIRQTAMQLGVSERTARYRKGEIEAWLSAHK